MSAASAIAAAAAAQTRLSSADSPHEGKFVAGTLLAARYRITGLLGKGGMGEVYRAIDLTLGQPVALKFLPEAAIGNPAGLARLRDEVCIARQVSHPNVCRVHDIGEVAGQYFISMEYVDGENMSSLLHRIGRLPASKAVEIARCLCAGLAAAHDKGILHRDLKPANIMIDGRGQVRIVDFGLAGIVQESKGAESIAGTPAYMSPEQLSGKRATVQSDIYALGLVLYEVFTGKRVFVSNSWEELIRMHQDLLLASPSSLVSDLDPAIDQIILRCLDPVADNRPQSVRMIAAALPGHDPLAGVLAAGETPSPEMVAAIAQTGGLSVVNGAFAVAAVVIGLAAIAALSSKVNLIERVHLERRPEVLAQNARDIITDIGYKETPIGTAYGFRYQPPMVQFWYRQSLQHLESQSTFLKTIGRSIGLSVAARVTPADPPATVPGMVTAFLDPLGHLVYLEAVPAQVKDSRSPPAGFDWDKLFRASGLDMRSFFEAKPAWTPRTAFDGRGAWTGTDPQQANIALRVEAASWLGKPVLFQIVGPSTKPDRSVGSPGIPGWKFAGFAMWLAIGLAVAVVALVLARRNSRLGRGDRRGAWRLAAFMFGVSILTWLLASNHVPTSGEFARLPQALGESAALGGLLWLFYIALEPYVRRRWPEALISWTRVLNGGFRDPLVGADLLMGAVSGVACTLVLQVRYLVVLGRGEAAWHMPDLNSLLSVRELAAHFLTNIPQAMIQALVFLFVLFGIRNMVPKRGIAAAIAVVLLTVPVVLGSAHPLTDAVFLGAIIGIMALVLIRYGLTALVTTYFVHYLVAGFPITADLSAWYAGASLFVLSSVLALAIYGFNGAVQRRALSDNAV